MDEQHAPDAPISWIRVVFDNGISATRAGGSWRLSGARTPVTLPRLPAVARELKSEPVLITDTYPGGTFPPFLLDRRTRNLYGLGITAATGVDLNKNTFFQVSDLRYLLGAVEYHCTELAEAYVAVSTAYVGFPSIPDGPEPERTGFGGHAELYYEFDACVTAALRVYEASRYLLWSTFGKGTMPESFRKTLAAFKDNSQSIPERLLRRLDQSWNTFGKRLKAYRDCIQHKSPIDYGIVTASLRRHELGVWMVRVLIPENPECNSRRSFVYKEELDALDYCMEVASEVLELTAEICKIASAEQGAR